MVCPNCKHEVNSLARVCPTCGTQLVAGPVPTVVIPPPAQEALPAKRGVTAARVFVIIFCLAAVGLNGLLAWSWFLSAVEVVSKGGSVRTYSMYQLCSSAAPYLTWIVCGLCFVSAVFCVIPLFKHYADRRTRLLAPKLATILCAVCYAVPYTVVSVAKVVTAVINGGDVSHSNPFTTICLALFILLCVTAELSAYNRRLVNEHRIEDLRAQLTAHGIRPIV